MRLSIINEGIQPRDIIGKWVHIKVPFFIQWSAISKCKKGNRITPFNYGPMEIALVCDVTLDTARSEMSNNYTVTCFFPTVLGGKGAIGSQTAESLDALVKIYK
jgi:hypothetical protein